ncbi:RNA methyltransferase [Sesbania bispinosa]|nr:RNA methyltransferase [Sesbania bispinosa]
MPLPKQTLFDAKRVRLMKMKKNGLIGAQVERWMNDYFFRQNLEAYLWSIIGQEKHKIEMGGKGVNKLIKEKYVWKKSFEMPLII